ncbi:MAG: helix-turn-helix domain-containing protein [Bacteroidales bacterium]|nr:helix-turn-helix domain-containing protein [Bacteroidales bacterium]
MNIQELAQCAPAINITITAAELKDFATQLIAETKAELEQSISESKAEAYLTGEKVMEMLEISKATLYRWKQRGYLVPIRIGGNDRYRQSDINHILQKGGPK